MANLRGDVLLRNALTGDDVRRMHDLMLGSFADVDRGRFESDLNEKRWVILLRDIRHESIHGFTTICLMEQAVRGVPVRAVFTGDTVIERPYWASLALERTWTRFVWDRLHEKPESPLYWFLICKGYRTYRYLPIYFRDYYPAPVPTPDFEQAVIDSLAAGRYGGGYDREAGVIRCPGDYRLRPGVSDISGPELEDPRVSFFRERNPGWRSGDELACLVRIHPDNVRPAFLRMLGRGSPA